MFLALAREATEKMDAALEKALGQAGTASGKILGHCRASAAVRREYAELAWIVDAILSGPPEAGPRFDFKGRITGFVRRLEAIVQQGVESGEFRSCDTHHAALAVMGAVEIAARHRIFGTPASSPDESLEGMLSVIFNGLNARSGSPKVRREEAPGASGRRDRSASAGLRGFPAGPGRSRSGAARRRGRK